MNSNYDSQSRRLVRQELIGPLPLRRSEGRGEGCQGLAPAGGAAAARIPLALLLAGLGWLLLAAGCVTKSKAEAQARAAFLAGQQQARMQMQQTQTMGQGPCVTVNGEVRNHVVLWTQGLTLAKAVVAANYCGATDPAQIIIVHNGLANHVDPKQLLSGADIPLQPGDTVQLVPQPGMPNP